MRRIPLLACAFLLTTLVAGGALAQSPARTGSPTPAAAAADERFLRFEEPAADGSHGAIVPEPATLGMIMLGGAGLFYPRRRGRLYR